MAYSVNRVLRIGIVAGEASGDLLAATLMQSLRDRGVVIEAEGVVGPHMLQQGCRALASIEELACMGIPEILKRLPRLIRLRYRLARHFIKNKPDIFIGVDAPEFNLGLEKKLKKHHIPVIHYVCPSVWAWRQRRVKKIAKAVDLVLALLPFEVAFLQKYGIPVTYVGHPLADALPMHYDREHIRRQFNISLQATVIALLPGSRSNEIAYLGKLFIQVAQRCRQLNSDLLFLAAMVDKKRAEQFTQIWRKTAPDLTIRILQQKTHAVIAAADVVLVASGTATLEALLLKKPMVVVYRMANISYWIARLLVRVRFIALPNLLADSALVPEFIQGDATVTSLVEALFNYLHHPQEMAVLEDAFIKIHQQLRCNASLRASEALLNLLNPCIVLRK